MFGITRYVCLNAVLAAVVSAASVGGIVYNPAGAVVAGAEVTLAGVQNGYRQVVATNEKGRFGFSGVAPGRYRLEVRGPGFAPFYRENLALEAASDAKLPVFLHLGTVTESLEVTSQAPAGAKTAQTAPAPARVSGQFEPPRVARMLRVPYPESARARGAQGTVVVRGVVLEDGTLADLAAGADADPELAEAALSAIRGWRYQPALLDGRAVAFETVVSIEYKLQ